MNLAGKGQRTREVIYNWIIDPGDRGTVSGKKLEIRG